MNRWIDVSFIIITIDNPIFLLEMPIYLKI